jgi:dihydroorotase
MELTLPRPDDWHLHVRDGTALCDVIAHTARRFARAIIMPNLKPPVTTTPLARAYRARIRAALPDDSDFVPLMTLYLTDHTTADCVREAAQSGIVHGVKLYPAGATTHSDAGVTDIGNVGAALEALQEHGMPLLVHAEITDATVDVFDRERVFIDRVLEPLTRRFPQLKIVFEHVTTQEGVDFVLSGSPRLAGTITAHHLLLNRNAMFSGGIRTHHYCLPVLKREPHRQALVRAATSGNPKFFLGTDSAPHARERKESGCGCAGIYTAHAALELYAQAFEEAGALDRLAGFASEFGADFYGLPRNTGTVTLAKHDWVVPGHYSLGDSSVIPLAANQTLHWRIRE